MKNSEHARTEDQTCTSKKEWITPAIEIIDIESGVVAGPEGVLTFPGLQSAGVDS